MFKCCSKVTLTTAVYLACSNKIPQSNNDLVHKTCQLHVLNLTTSHIPALSLPLLLSFGLSVRLIYLNASLNSSIGLSYLFSQKHSSGQFSKFLLKSKHCYFFFVLARWPKGTAPEDETVMCVCMTEDVYVRKGLTMIRSLQCCIIQSLFNFAFPSMK